MKRVLITGAAGLIGGIVREAFSDRYELSGVDVRPVAGMESAAADMRGLKARAGVRGSGQSPTASTAASAP